MILILSILISLVSLACWIYVLVKIFQSGDTLWGILGICPLVAFVYGWVKHQQLGIKQVMLVWTGVIVLNIILNIAFAPSQAGAM